VCSITCSTVTTSLPLVANSGTYSAARRPVSTDPSLIRCQTAAATNGLVAEYTTYRVATVASPNASSTTILSSMANAS